MKHNIQVLILAAGAASRFGSAKQLLEYQDKSLLQHCIDKANTVCHGRVSVVLGASRERIEPLISGARITYNNDWQQGLASSIVVGVENRDPCCEGVWILLADQIALTTDDFNLLLNAFDGDNTVSAYYAGRRGVPAIFPSSLFADLAALCGDSGAKTVLQRSDINIIEIELAKAVMDIDTPEDWAQFLDSLN